MDLNNIKLGYSPLSKTIHMFRHGKDERVALDKRDAIADVQGSLIEFMLDGMPNGAKQEVCFGSQWYEITVKPINEDKEENSE